MPILVILFLILLAIGYSISSILGVLVSGGVYVLFSFLFYKYEDEKDSPMYYLGKITFVVPLAIILTTPIWDEAGYCSHQTERTVVGYERSLKDVFEGKKEQEIVAYKGISERCIAEGGWEYAGGWEVDKNIRALLLYPIGFIVLLPLIVFLYIIIAATKDAGFSNIFQELKQILTRNREEDFRKIFGKEELQAIKKGNLMQVLEDRAMKDFKSNPYVYNDWSVGLNLLGISYYNFFGHLDSPTPDFMTFQFHGEDWYRESRPSEGVNKDKARELAIKAFNSFKKLTPTELNTIIKIRESRIDPKLWKDNKKMRNLAESEAKEFSIFCEEVILLCPEFEEIFEDAKLKKENRRLKKQAKKLK